MNFGATIIAAPPALYFEHASALLFAKPVTVAFINGMLVSEGGSRMAASLGG